MQATLKEEKHCPINCPILKICTLYFKMPFVAYFSFLGYDIRKNSKKRKLKYDLLQ